MYELAKVYNLTPHTVTITPKDDLKLQIPPSEKTARCKIVRETHEYINGVPINRVHYGEVTGLPDYEDGTYYIVSVVVANALPERKDLLVPDDLVRDETGSVIGCRALARTYSRKSDLT